MRNRAYDLRFIRRVTKLLDEHLRRLRSVTASLRSEEPTKFYSEVVTILAYVQKVEIAFWKVLPADYPKSLEELPASYWTPDELKHFQAFRDGLGSAWARLNVGVGFLDARNSDSHFPKGRRIPAQRLLTKSCADLERALDAIHKVTP